MKFQLIYFSGTGNTKRITEIIEKNLSLHGEVEIISLESVEKNIELIDKDAILGFGYPVYDLNPPKHSLNILDQIKPVKAQKAFVFSTYSSYPLDSNYHVVKLLQEKGYIVTTITDFKSPGASLYLYGNPNNPLLKSKSRFEKDITAHINDFTADIINHMNIDVPMDLVFNKFNTYHKVASEFIFKNLFYKNLTVNEDCTNCGKCVKLCPIGNLSLDDKILIHQKNDCLKCLRCIQACPKRAINFTKAKRKGDYIVPSIN